MAFKPQIKNYFIYDNRSLTIEFTEIAVSELLSKEKCIQTDLIDGTISVVIQGKKDKVTRSKCYPITRIFSITKEALFNVLSGNEIIIEEYKLKLRKGYG